MKSTDVTIQVEVQGRNPDELIAEAVRHAVAFFPALPPTAYEVDLGTVYPVFWHEEAGQRSVRLWQADAVVRPRPPKASGGCTC